MNKKIKQEKQEKEKADGKGRRYTREDRCAGDFG